MTSEEQKKLFAEWEEDYAARREENRREGAPIAGPRESWPSEIAEANRAKQSGEEHGRNAGRERSHGHDDGHSM